jgi:hypothetical protein
MLTLLRLPFLAGLGAGRRRLYTWTQPSVAPILDLPLPTPPPEARSGSSIPSVACRRVAWPVDLKTALRQSVGDIVKRPAAPSIPHRDASKKARRGE